MSERTYKAICVGGPADGTRFETTKCLKDVYHDGVRYRVDTDSFGRMVKLADGTIVFKPWSAIR